ncbi:MAG TPA: ABC transporter permease [Acidimicrobiales bacterium]|jgi:peptide/nickel transport system permease protein|nr:ABC transporter permease [Acidimicrobiales bacterium]
MAYLGRRMFFYLVTAVVAVSLNFFLPHLMPGNPAEIVISMEKTKVSPHQLQALEALFGVNTHQSVLVQYVNYWGNLLHGSLGRSITYFPDSVTSVIVNALPWTVILVGVSTVISFLLGTLLGVVVAWRRGSFLDSLLPATTFFSAVPYFWLGLLAILVFATELHFFPAAGSYADGLTVGFTGPFILSAAYHSVLPALTIVLSSLAGWLLGMRNMTITTMSEDYVVVAKAKGLPDRTVMLAYAARNALLPNLASFAMSLGFIVSGALLVEIVFSYPGIGYALYQAVTNEDYPLMQGIFLIITLAVLGANFLADACYALLDPRVRRA